MPTLSVEERVWQWQGALRHQPAREPQAWAHLRRDEAQVADPERHAMGWQIIQGAVEGLDAIHPHPDQWATLDRRLGQGILAQFDREHLFRSLIHRYQVSQNLARSADLRQQFDAYAATIRPTLTTTAAAYPLLQDLVALAGGLAHAPKLMAVERQLALAERPVTRAPTRRRRV